jgi:SAM-dependent methyltransferase
MSVNQHADPARDPAPDRSLWPAYWRDAVKSNVLAEFRAALSLGEGTTPRASVIDDLCTHYGCSEDACIDECVNWGRYFDAEWDAASSPAEFHRTTRSSSFSLLWAAYCQAEGYAWPGCVATVEAVQRAGHFAGDHLDFAAGVGAMSQLFARLGYRTTLADISTSMLEFARFRLERRGTQANYIDLNTERLPVGAYDVITATDVLWLIPEPTETFRALHDALKPNGVLFANINPSTSKAARWQIYDEDLPVRRQLQACGFEPLALSRCDIYRKVPATGPMHACRMARDAMLLGPVREIYRSASASLNAYSARRHARAPRPLSLRHR